jgi:hypothetical protein
MKNSIRVISVVTALASLAAGAARAAPCDGPDFRQFDFWVGEWRVETPDGKFRGINRIDREYGGCVIHEHYVTGRGDSGESLNIYDASRKLWHQSWVDNTGTLLVLEGHFNDGRMVLEGEAVGTDGQVSKQRITWTPNPDGTVRQLWEATDAKGAWTTSFDGLYTKK